MTTQSTHADLVIVGGGLVGASLACALAPTGLRVAIVEAVPFRSQSQPSYDDRLLALSQGTKRILAAMDVWPGVVQRDATPIEAVHISDRGHCGMARLSCRQFGVDALGYVVPARVLGMALMEYLQGAQEFEYLCPATVRGIDVAVDEVRLDIEQGGGARRLTARLAVLADGGRSRTREMLGMSASEQDYMQNALLTTVTPELPHANRAYERFTPTGPLAMLPTSRNRCGVVWTTQRDGVDSLMELNDAGFLELLQRRFGDRLGRLARLGKRTTYPLTLIRVDRVVAARAVLIGNAAHVIHPVAGQGFNLGLRDVAALAEVLVDAATSGADIGDHQVLMRYADWRRRDTGAVTGFTDGLIRVFANDFPPAVLSRNLALSVLDKLPFAKRMLVRRTMGLHGRLSKLGCGRPLVGGS